MITSYKDKRKAAKAFAKTWKGRGYEKGDSQVFWTELLRDVVGLDRISSNVKFEHRTSGGGFIDALIPDAGVLIEQKALRVDLDKPEVRQGREVTPFQQALAYAESFPQHEQPRFIVVCNFEIFRVHDRQSCSRGELPGKYVEFTLEELGENPSFLDFIADPANSRIERQRQVSMEAGAQIGKLFAALREQYLDPDSPESQHSLNVLCVRLVFCLFCEDAELFQKDALLNYLKPVPASDMRRALKDLFCALNTPVERRDPYERDKFAPFPYVNGGLFADEVEIPSFTEEIKFMLLFDASQETDWSHISPTIFGGIFESTLNPETRRSGGMHYTSPENIHKVIDPLFLDALREEFDSIRMDAALTAKKRKRALEGFRKKIGSLRFLDPACGSGNFLTETYLSLRELENDVLNELNDGQMMVLFGGDEGIENNERVSLDQFYGIEVNDFAVRVAKTALWIAQLQANNRSEMLLDLSIKDFPLTDSPNIVHGNALALDWNDVLPASKCDYIIGNPPFLGARNQSKEQKAELADVFDGAKNCGNVDYVAGWYIKAADYMKGHPVRAAFVSTNSICQGEQVANIWHLMRERGFCIDFAHDTFRWRNEAADQAHVFVVIVGFSEGVDAGTANGRPLRSEASQPSLRASHPAPKRLFHHATPDAEAQERTVLRLNAYLADAPDVFIWNRSKPLFNAPAIGIGNKPIDGGNYLFKPEEKDAFVAVEPLAQKYFHRWLGSDEFIKGKERWVLWLGNVSPADLKQMPKSRERIQAVREYRLASTSAPTRKLAERPNRFHVENMPEGTSILVPKVSSERRRYVPLGFVEPDVFCSDLVFLIPDATLYHFGVLHSSVHNAWMRTVAGRLKSDYRYSGGVVYNNFPWPAAPGVDLTLPVEELVSTEVRRAIEDAAQAVLDARALYAGSTIADMYDPDNDFLYPQLTAAHKALDTAVEAAYGVSFNGDEERMVAHLFRLYAEATGEQSI